MRALLWMVLLASWQATAWAQIQQPQPELHEPITVAAQEASRWQQVAYDVWLLRGNCMIRQGITQARSQHAVLWVEQAGRRPTKIIAYLEGGVAIDYGRRSAGQNGTRKPVSQVTDQTWFGRFHSTAPLDWRVSQAAAEPRAKPPVFHRAMAQFNGEATPTVERTPFSEFGAGPAPADPVPRGSRRVRAFPRSDVRVQAQWFPSADRREWVAVVTSGVNLLIDGMRDWRSLDISTDRLVVWTTGGQTDLTGQTLQSDDTPLEIYMEGNIVFREGDRVIHAERMYYDVTNKFGIVLDAELLTPVPDFEGLLRLKAGIIRQLHPDHFVAHDALLTSSRMGNPRYHFGSSTITFDDIQEPAVNFFTGQPVLDPLTGEPVIEHQRLANSRNNLLYAGGVPLFYWPTMATDLENPAYYINSLALKNDQIFGTQVEVGLDGYQILGLRNPPRGTKLSFDIDYLSERGWGTGGNFRYDRAGMLGFPGRARGLLDAWGINDGGLDNLGAGRRAVMPEEDFRGRILWNHRHRLPSGYTLSAETGLISDRNFLEQYFEQEWDRRKDQTTGVELKKVFDNQSWSVTSDVRLNDFFTQTEWLPRGDHFWLGESLWSDRLTWFEHSSVGYARLRTASTDPTVPIADVPRYPLQWEASVAGERASTRQEIDLPLDVGPVKVVPYALGELTHWGEALDGEPLQRAYGQVGARASIPFWTADPTVENHLLNVHGLAHKVMFDAEFLYADANRDVTELPLYDPLDDDNIEHFRRRLFFNTFGGVGDPLFPDDVPLRFDERIFAVRSGLGGWVTSPSTEVADDLMAMRLGMRHRWQTKRGRPGQQRIVDWIVLDTNLSWFPKEDRDNFGEPLGLVDYDFRWHIGDRLTLVSDGLFDFFPDGLKVATIGAYMNRLPRGNLYLGFRSLEGPVSSNVINANFQYRMSPKWVSTFATSVDLSNVGNVGQNFSITRVGESLLIRAGFNYNESKDVFRVTFMVEPRFLPRSQRGRATHVRVPPAGAFGLE